MNANKSKSFYRKIRNGKKSFNPDGNKKQRRTKKVGKIKIVGYAAVSETVRKSVIRNEDNNSGTDSLSTGLSLAESTVSKLRISRKPKKYSGKFHKKAGYKKAYRETKDKRNLGKADEKTQSENVKAARKKQMTVNFYKESAKKTRENARKARNTGKKIADKTNDILGSVAKMGQKFLEENPLILILAATTLLSVIVVSGAFTSCSAFGGGINSGTVATSFTAKDNDIKEVENNYISLEKELQERVNRIEADKPGYDEYNYSLSEISHNPFVLAALLTVLYESYTPAEVQSMLTTVFDYQYKLELKEITEKRTKTETRTGERWVSDGVVNGKETGHTESYEYDVEVEYDYHILNVTLENKGISAAISALSLNKNQMERYNILMETRGNKPEIFAGNVYANPGVSKEYESYAVPGEYLTDTQFSKLQNEAKKYLGYPYVWGGASPATSFDCSGFVSYVINHSGNGWNYGRLTANGWKNATLRVSEADVKAGDLVFFQGTYSTAGASHVGIVVDPKKKTMIHCGNPIQYTSYDTPYWRAHAYCYGRIK